jgi:glycosyltransferase involved in cell wall biosynthesis
MVLSMNGAVMSPRVNKSPVKSALKMSVLVPVYNGERFLAECLDSILMQDFPDVEILVSDDHSSDGSAGLIEKYAALAPRIRWWRNPRRVGLTANSNICLREAKGEYIKFVHQDDKLLHPSALSKYVEALDNHSTAVLAGSRQHVTGKKLPPAIFRFQDSLYEGRQMIRNCFELNNNLIGQPSLTAFRRMAAGRGFDERFVGHMDFEMWCHLLEQGDYVHLNEPLATWRVHPGQQTAQFRNADYDPLLLMETYYDKAWLQQTATSQLLFTQIYYLQKKFGSSADGLTRNYPCRNTRGIG